MTKLCRRDVLMGVLLGYSVELNMFKLKIDNTMKKTSSIVKL